MDCKDPVIAHLTTVAPLADLQGTHKTHRLYDASGQWGIFACRTFGNNNTFSCSLGCGRSSSFVYLLFICILKVAVTTFYMPIKCLWKILQHGPLLGVDASLFFFLWPDALLVLLSCIQAPEQHRHREDSPAGGRSHAISTSRGPATGSLPGSSNTPHILLPFIKAVPLPPPQTGAKTWRILRHRKAESPFFSFSCEVHYLNSLIKVHQLQKTDGFVLLLSPFYSLQLHIHISCNYTSKKAAKGFYQCGA